MTEKSFFLSSFAKYLLQTIAENYLNIGYNVLIWLFFFGSGKTQSAHI
jgi:hypothetical protein